METMKVTKYCQSCAMPMTEENHFGINPDGSKNEEYCCYCMQDGKLTDSTLPQMIDICSDIMLKEGAFSNKEEALAFVGKTLPTLRRWRTDDIAPTVVEFPETVIAGLAIKTSNSSPSMNADMYKLWGDFYSTGLSNKVTGGKPVFCYGAYSDYTDGVNGEYTVTVGAPCSGDIPEGAAVKTIPAGKYLRFFVDGDDMSAVGEAWNKIWGMQLDRTYNVDFEEYLTETSLYIYIGIK